MPATEVKRTRERQGLDRRLLVCLDQDRRHELQGCPGIRHRARDGVLVERSPDESFLQTESGFMPVPRTVTKLSGPPASLARSSALQAAVAGEMQCLRSAIDPVETEVILGAGT